MRQLPLELAEALNALFVELSRNYSLLDSATRLALMATVAKATLRGQFLDVGETTLHAAAIPELNLAETWQVHQQTGPWNSNELTTGGRVAAATIAFSDRAGSLAIRP